MDGVSWIVDAREIETRHATHSVAKLKKHTVRRLQKERCGKSPDFFFFWISGTSTPSARFFLKNLYVCQKNHPKIIVI